MDLIGSSGREEDIANSSGQMKSQRSDFLWPESLSRINRVIKQYHEKRSALQRNVSHGSLKGRRFKRVSDVSWELNHRQSIRRAHYDCINDHNEQFSGGNELQ